MTKLRRVCVVATAIAATAVFAGTAFAQRGGGFGGGGGGWLGLLRIEAVQKELKLTEDQQADLKKIADEVSAKMREQFSGFRDADEAKREELRKKMAETTQEIQKKVAKEILTEGQVTRVKQLLVQSLGASALGNAEVAADVGLSDPQKEKVAAILKESRDAMTKAFSGMRDLSAEQRRDQFTKMRETMDKSRKQTEESLMGLLSAAQKEKFEKAKGAPFDTSLLRPQFGRGGRGGAPGGAPPQN